MPSDTINRTRNVACKISAFGKYRDTKTSTRVSTRVSTLADKSPEEFFLNLFVEGNSVEEKILSALISLAALNLSVKIISSISLEEPTLRGAVIFSTVYLTHQLKQVCLSQIYNSNLFARVGNET